MAPSQSRTGAKARPLTTLPKTAQESGKVELFFQPCTEVAQAIGLHEATSHSLPMGAAPSPQMFYRDASAS